MQVRFLGQEDPPEEGTTTHSSILAWRITIDRGAWRVHKVTKSRKELKQLSVNDSNPPALWWPGLVSSPSEEASS